MNTVILKTGKTVPDPVVETTMLALKSLASKGSLALFELVELCKNSNHQLWDDNVGEELKTLSLIQANGCVHKDVKEIVLAAVSGEGLRMSLSDPVASREEPFDNSAEDDEDYRFVPEHTECPEVVISDEEIKSSAFYNPELHRLAHRIIDIIFEYATDDERSRFDTAAPYLVDKRNRAYALSSRRHSEGFILETDSDVPLTLFTPWGIWYFAGGGGWPNQPHTGWLALMPQLAERFAWEEYSADEITSKTYSNLPNLGWGKTYYSICQVDGVSLPAPRDLGFCFTDEEESEAKAAWSYLQEELRRTQNKE